MRKNWKRILAATLAACMIFCDSSLVYAAESQPIVEASETETEVETTEIGDETTLPEATEEDVVTEESTEEVEDVEPVEETKEESAEEESAVEEIAEETEQEEILPEEVPVEEEEVVEIKAVTEVSSVAQMNSATGNTVLAPGEEVTVTGSDTRYVKNFDFTATESGKYCLYVRGTSSLILGSIQVYEEDGTTINYTIQPEMCYDLDVDAEDVYDLARGYILEAETTYKINVQGSVATGEEATFWFGKVSDEPTQLVADSNTETVKAGELKLYTISEEELQTGGLYWTGDNPEIYVSSSSGHFWQYTFDNSARTEGQRALIIPAGETYYVTVRTTSETDTNITWKHVDAETIGIGETNYISTEINGTASWKFYEFEPDVEKDYLISANGTKSDGSWNTENYMWTAVILEDGSLRAHKSTYTSQIDSSSKNYGEDYTDAYGNTWLRVQFPENCKKFYICAYQYSTYWQTAVYLDEIVHPITLKPDVETLIEGDTAEYEYEKWHEIIPAEDTYYYLDSDVLSVTGIAIWDNEGQYYSSAEPDFFCMFKPGLYTYTDVLKCYKLEANTTYGVRLTGTIPTEGASFTWRTTNASLTPEKLDLGGAKKVTSATSPDIYEISEDTHTLGILTYADYGFGNVGFFGDFGRSMELEEGTQGSPAAKKVYAMIAPAGKKTYITASAMTESTLTWEDAQPTVLTSGYEEIIESTVDTIKCYEFTPTATDEYQLLVQGDLTQVSMISSQGDFMDLAEETTDEDGNTWLNYSNLSDIDIAYVLVQVNANSTGRVAFKQLTSAVDEGNINDKLTVDQLVSVSGGESGNTIGKWYDFVPEKSGYYYLESDTFRESPTYAIYSEIENTISYSPNLQVRCVLKPDATTVNDVITSHFFEAGTHYRVYVYGTAEAGSFKTFTWKECDAPDDSTEVYLDGEPITVPGGEISIYKLCAEETTVANVYVDGWNLLNVYGDNYAGLLRGYIDGYTNQHEKVMSVGKGKTYYYVLAPTEDVTITFKEEETKTIKPGDSFTVEAPSDARYDIVCYEFVPEAGAKYEAHYGIGGGNKAIAIMEKDGNLSWVNEGTITDSDGKLWTEINATDNIEKIYLFTLAEAGTPQMVALKSDAPTDPYNITLNTFDGVIDVPAGETVTVTYEGPHLGDYFIANGNVNFKSTYVGPGLKTPVLYTWLNSGQFYTYSFSDNYDVNTVDTAKFTFTLENTTENDQSISIGNSLASYTWDPNQDDDGNLIWAADMETEKKGSYASYYRFIADETTVYSHPEIAWVMRVQDAKGNNDAIRWDKYELEDGKIILNAGETYIFKFISDKSMKDPDWYSIPAVYAESCWTATDSTIFYDGQEDDISVYHFTPILSGRYSNGTKNQIVTVWEQNAENGTWIKVSKLADSANGYADYELSSEKEYLVVFDESTVFGLKNNVTVLDYDYYDTFVNTATGGAISVDENGKVTITPKSKGAKLVAKICSILGLTDYSDEETLEALEDGNNYWKGFVPKKIYKLVNNQLVDDTTGCVEDGDVVVVKYEPEVVWVHSMTVTADKTVMNIDDESQIYVDAKAATAKYPLDNPIFTYVSSNPEIVSVDKDGKMIAHAAGKVKITVMADVAARFAERCSNKILKKELSITVSQRFNVNYENLYDTNGDAIGYLNEATPIEYNTLETTALGEPTAVEGYDFVGWYSNEALSKKITSIAKGSTGDKTIYAKWKLHDYNINYELGEGKFSADVNQPTTFTMDKETVLADPIRQGYVLDYWYWMKEDSAGELYEEELPYNFVKENPEDPDSPDKKVWYIPEKVKEDVQIFAKWKFDTQFSLTINGEKDEDGNITITHPYNSATGEWDYLNSSFVIQSNTEGIVPELYYNEDVNLSVTATLMKLNEDGSVFGTIASWDSDYDRYKDYEFYRVTDLIADDIKAPGKYRLEVCYTHPGQDMQYLEQEFTVNYAKREYPVNKEVSWSALSNVDSNRTYSMIASEIADKMQPDESVFITGLGERKLAFDTELVNVIFKDSKNRVVKNTAKVTSGTYTVVLEFAENDRFLTEATGTVNISYGTIASAGVQYLAAETLEDTDAEGRIPGSTIAFEILKLDEEGNPVVDDAGEPITINTTPYVNGVQIDPIVKVPWNTEAIPVAALKASLEANGYDGYTVSVGVSDASRKAFLTFSEVTSAITKEIVAYVVTGNAAGKANLVFETTITDAEGNEVAVIPTTIKNFTVVNGGVDAVESITLDLYKTEEIVDENLFKPKEADATGVKTYLIEKDEVARTYWLDVEALNYEGNSPENVKLSWKSSNSKLAAVKTAKDGTVTLTILQNAQGVVDITVTAKDAAKNSQSIKFVIVDTSMRLDTTSLTMNSKIEGESAVAYLYPNVLASELDGISLEDLFEDEGKIALYDRKKSGKTYIYEPSAVFDSEYNVKTGELLVTFNSKKYPAKAATHTVYVGILHEGDVLTGEDESKIVNPSEVYALKIKDTCALPKAPSLKVTKNYEAVYKEGWAELTLTLKSPVARIYDANVDDGSEEDNWTPAIQVKNTSLFEVVAWEDLSYGDGTTWKLKLRANDPSVLPDENQKSKVTKNVEFAIGYDGYRQDEDAIATTKANITAVRTLPTLYVYGEDAYAPVYYTDADYRYVDVVIPVTKELINGIVDESSKDMDGNADSSGAIISLAEDKELEIVLADAKPNSPSKFEVVDAEVRNYDFKVPGKKDSVEVEHAIAMTVMVNSSQTKNVNLQFNVRSTALEDGVTITTKALEIKPRTIKSESISLVDRNTEKSIKNLNFNSNYAGKESIEIEVMKPATLSGLSELNGFEYKSCILVEAADKNTQKMLQNNDLLVEADEYGDVFKVTSTSDSFKYKTAKLKITMVANEDTGNPLKTKSTTLTVNFKKALTPKITISNAKIIRGLNVYGKGFEHAEYWGDWVETKVKYANMPVGAEVIDVRFADQADYTKYFDPYEYIGYESVPEYLYIEARPEAKLSLGKDAIGLIYDVRSATGEVISIHATLNLTIADSFNLKTDVKSINLYNSAVGKDYGKYVTFSDTKGHAVEVLEIINEVELKNAGINFDLTATTEEELTKEHSKEVLGKDAVKFYVDGTLKRGIEKTYTVKAKVAVVDSAVKENETLTTTTATEKTLTFKIVLKK